MPKMLSMHFYVYALKSQKDGRIYVGMTSDLKRRFHEHNSGYTRSTKSYSPWILIYFESCSSRTEARIREKNWKGGSGKEALKRIANLYTAK